MDYPTFSQMFVAATGQAPFPYQTALAKSPELYELVNAPTGSGKTAAAVLGWLWRCFHSGKPTPRRLIYCLPMRVLVEQTRNEAIRWLHKLNRLAPAQQPQTKFDPENPDHLRDYRPDLGDATAEQVAVVVLMGGVEREDWDLYPEKPAILIGTQDMLLSRALNRGYGMGRFRWPMHFGLVNNDCLWVLDEIQLMGVGLATSAQLQAFREKYRTFGAVKTVWMSATLQSDWLGTVDFRQRVPELSTLNLTKEDYTAGGLRERWTAKKPLDNSKLSVNDVGDLAAFIKDKHQANSLTLVVVNTVSRSRELHAPVKKLIRAGQAAGYKKEAKAGRGTGWSHAGNQTDSFSFPPEGTRRLDEVAERNATT